MRVLFLCTHVPVPVTNGQSIRTMSLVRALTECGHAVTFLSFVSPERKADKFEPLSSICKNVRLVSRKSEPLSSTRSMGGRLAVLLRAKSYGIERFRSRRMRTAIREELESTRYDVIVADSLYVLVNLPVTKTPMLLNCHNIEWLIWDRYAQLEKNPLKRAYVQIEGRRLREAEQASWGESAACMVCSGQDADVLQQLAPDKRVSIVPNCIDTLAYNPSETEAACPTILFQGGMDWYPNRDAIEYFVSRILPAIREQIPEARFVVAGRNPSPEFIRSMSAGGGVEFTGTVPDMRPYLAKASVAVVPLRIGSGTRLKILEAAAAGVAIVSTALGAEGLQFIPGLEIILADEPQQFACEVVALLRDVERRRLIGRSARRRVVEQYSLASLRAQVSKCLSEAVAHDHMRLECCIESESAATS